jgi:hypothetical protein
VSIQSERSTPSDPSLPARRHGALPPGEYADARCCGSATVTAHPPATAANRAPPLEAWGGSRRRPPRSRAVIENDLTASRRSMATLMPEPGPRRSHDCKFSPSKSLPGTRSMPPSLKPERTSTATAPIAPSGSAAAATTAHRLPPLEHSIDRPRDRRSQGTDRRSDRENRCLDYPGKLRSVHKHRRLDRADAPSLTGARRRWHRSVVHFKTVGTTIGSRGA